MIKALVAYATRAFFVVSASYRIYFGISLQGICESFACEILKQVQDDGMSIYSPRHAEFISASHYEVHHVKTLQVELNKFRIRICLKSGLIVNKLPKL